MDPFVRDIGISFLLLERLAQIHLAQKDPENAMRTIQRALEHWSEEIDGILNDPTFAPLKELPEFQLLQKKISKG